MGPEPSTGQPPITPITALRVDEEGRLTYMGQDGQRYVIVGDAEILTRFQQLKDREEGAQ